MWDSTEAAMKILRPGTTYSQLKKAIDDSLEKDGYKTNGKCIGRAGHGLGLELTEWPSVIQGKTWEIPLKPGMVLTLEPSLPLEGGGELCHEENYVVTEDGYEILSERAPREMVHINIKK